MNATCKTCPFWQERPGRPEGEQRDGYGICHHSRAAFARNESWSYGDWWCSEHPLRQRDRLAANLAQGITAGALAFPDSDGLNTQGGPLWVAMKAYAIADAMLAEAAKRLGAEGNDK